MNQPSLQDICCPEFNPAPREDQVAEWTDKRFVKNHACTIFYMLLNFGKVMKRLNEKVMAAVANMPD